MKEKIEALEELNENILLLTAKCTEVIKRDSENGRVIYQHLEKLSTKINVIRLEIINKEES